MRPSTSTVPPTSAEPRAALVVGGAKGIGRAIAWTLAARGDDVVVADLDARSAEELVDELREDGLSARFEELDVTDVERVRSVVAVADAASPLATVVASAGVAFARPLEDVEPDEYDRLMAVNVRGVFFVVQAALPLIDVDAGIEDRPGHGYGRSMLPTARVRRLFGCPFSLSAISAKSRGARTQNRGREGLR